MARPEKFGHDYFPFYTSREDRKPLRLMQSKYDNDGYVCVLELDCLIRRVNGYYLPGNDETLSELSDYCGNIKRSKLEEILLYAIESGYYDEEKYRKYKIFTNKTIQEDHIYNSQRRNNLRIKKEYMLLTDEDIDELGIKRILTIENGYYQWFNVDINPINVNNNSVNVDNNSINVGKKYGNKIKEKKIIKKESKVNEMTSNENIGQSISMGKSISESEINIGSLHVVAQYLVNNDFLKLDKDILDIYEISDFCFELNTQEGFPVRKIRRAGLIMVKGLKKRRENPEMFENDPIKDLCAFFKQGLMNLLNSKPVDAETYEKHLEELLDGQ